MFREQLLKRWEVTATDRLNKGDRATGSVSGNFNMLQEHQSAVPGQSNALFTMPKEAISSNLPRREKLLGTIFSLRT
jgi:hypothetical protein